MAETPRSHRSMKRTRSKSPDRKKDKVSALERSNSDLKKISDTKILPSSQETKEGVVVTTPETKDGTFKKHDQWEFELNKGGIR